jgi:thioredoxin reductase
MAETNWDVIIVGGGPAGLSAALTLGRCRRRVLLCDAGQPRNRFSDHLHAYLTRDGTAPAELLELGRHELRTYPSVTLRQVQVIDAACDGGEFAITLESGDIEKARKLLLATGVVDHLPVIDGIEPLYGKSVHHCPYCDGWEWRDQALAVYGRGDGKGAGLALMLLQWSRDVVLLTDGPAQLSTEERTRLDANGVRVFEAPIARLEGEAGKLQRIVFSGAETIERAAMFFNTGQHQRSPLASRLGCDFTDNGGIVAEEHQVETSVAGLYAAGDATRDVQLVVVAAAEGVKAAFAINKALLAEDGLG